MPAALCEPRGYLGHGRGTWFSYDGASCGAAQGEGP
jgi:hypothetical protein